MVSIHSLPHTTGTASSPQQRWGRYGFPAACQKVDLNWDGPVKEMFAWSLPVILVKQSVIKDSDLQICRFQKMTSPPSLCFRRKRCCPGDTGRRAALRSQPACCPGRGETAGLSSGARGALPLAANQQHAAKEQEKEVIFSHTASNLCIG